MNNRNFIGIDINQEYVDISNKRIEVTPYTKENPNEKLKFLISRETILSKRKRKNKKEIFQESIDKKLDRIT